MKTNREAWLNEMARRLRPMFQEAGHPLPTNLRISCGFPSRNATPGKKQVIGQCFYDESSADKTFEIFISPVIGDAGRAADVLVHELCHAVLPPGTKHGPKFAKLATRMGLEGKPTATVAGTKLAADLDVLVQEVGPYPHAELKPLSTVKPQRNRMAKVTCPDCGYVARAAKKWLEIGAPWCPTHQKPMDREDDEPTEE